MNEITVLGGMGLGCKVISVVWIHFSLSTYMTYVVKFFHKNLQEKKIRKSKMAFLKCYD